MCVPPFYSTIFPMDALQWIDSSWLQLRPYKTPCHRYPYFGSHHNGVVGGHTSCHYLAGLRIIRGLVTLNLLGLVIVSLESGQKTCLGCADLNRKQGNQIATSDLSTKSSQVDTLLQQRLGPYASQIPRENLHTG